MKSESNLEKVLEAGKFAVTSEIGPPKSADGNVVRKKTGILKNFVDAANITDNQTAIVRLSSIAAASILLQEGIEPVAQMTVRDRNRIAIQSDILGAAALGVKNVLCLSGDHQKFGNHPSSKNVFDIDSMQLIRMLKDMRDAKKFQCGDEMDVEPRLFIGAAANPFADPFEFRVHRLAKKIDAGVDFIQTQGIYDINRFEKWLEEARSEGLTEKVYILGGVIPLKSAGAAKYIKNKVAGMIVPDSLIDRMKNAADPKQEGIKIAIETIEQLKDMKGVHGVHIMAIEWEEKVPEIVKESGLLPRPSV
ncbi:MAG: methylenetetrahydrofolate reductase [Methanomassiliicoccales archaeon]|nr:MAG: methylenetetrahydrofolate reductase [Methanomassiliicoccales archaeon]